MNCRVARQLPSQFVGAEFFEASPRRFEGIVRQRFGIHPAKEVMHDRVADYNHIADFGVLFSRGSNKLLDQSANLFPDQLLKAGLTVLQHSKVNPAHDVATVARLSV